MGKSKKYIITAAIITALGTILFLIGGSMKGFDFTALSTEVPTSASYTVDEEFDALSIRTTVADVSLAIAKDGVCRVECKEVERIQHTVTVEAGTLTIRLKDSRAWYEKIGVHFADMSVTVYLPEAQYRSVHVTTDTGTIYANDGLVFAQAKAESDTGYIMWHVNVTGHASLESDTGKVFLSGADIASLEVETSTGGVQLTYVNCGKMSIETDTGNVNITDSDASEIFVQSDTGNIKGHFLTDKVFTARSDTGKVKVPNTTSGGRCELITDTGNIIFE